MRQPKMRDVTHQMTRFFLEHKDDMQIALGACQSWAKRMIVLCCDVCAVFVGVLSTPPVDFLEFLSRKPKLPPFLR